MTAAPILLRDLDAEAKAAGEGDLSDALCRAATVLAGSATSCRRWLTTTWDGGRDASIENQRPELADRDALKVAAEIRERVEQLRRHADALARLGDQVEGAVFDMQDARRAPVPS